MKQKCWKEVFERSDNVYMWTVCVMYWCLKCSDKHFKWIILIMCLKDFFLLKIINRILLLSLKGLKTQFKASQTVNIRVDCLWDLWRRYQLNYFIWELNQYVILTELAWCVSLRKLFMIFNHAKCYVYHA